MEFKDFVTLYWNKKRRSGLPWSAQAIADDFGLSVDDVNMYLSWCGAHGSLTDEQLIAKFEAEITVVRSPMGNYLGPAGSAGSGVATIGQMPADAFWVQLQKLTGK